MAGLSGWAFVYENPGHMQLTLTIIILHEINVSSLISKAMHAGECQTGDPTICMESTYPVEVSSVEHNYNKL